MTPQAEKAWQEWRRSQIVVIPSNQCNSERAAFMAAWQQATEASAKIAEDEDKAWGAPSTGHLIASAIRKLKGD